VKCQFAQDPRQTSGLRRPLTLRSLLEIVDRSPFPGKFDVLRANRHEACLTHCVGLMVAIGGTGQVSRMSTH
jgi:hypothetical protein